MKGIGQIPGYPFLSFFLCLLFFCFVPRLLFLFCFVPRQAGPEPKEGAASPRRLLHYWVVVVGGGGVYICVYVCNVCVCVT